MNLTVSKYLLLKKLCVGNQRDAEYLFWKREGGELSEQRDEQNGVLIIYNVRETDAGKYMCVGMGKKGTILFSKTINLRVVGETINLV